MPNLVCLIVDSWHTGCCGWMGSDWIATPALDELACQGLVLDQAFVESPCLRAAYHAWWRGQPALASAGVTDSAAPGWTLPGALKLAGYDTALVTDDPFVEAHPLAGHWSRRTRVQHLPRGTVADAWEDTQLAAGMLASVQTLGDVASPFCLWVHLQGPAAAWDAPLEYRERYFDPEVTLPEPIVAPPSLAAGEDFDPDQRAAIRWSYAAQISLVDQAVAVLMGALGETKLLDDTAVVVTSPRGFSLGEHGWIGPAEESPHATGRLLHNEILHVPLIVRQPRGLGALARSSALVQPVDLAATLATLAGINTASISAAGADEAGADEAGWHPSAVNLLPLANDVWAMPRDRLLFRAGAERGIRTPSWFLRWKVDESSEAGGPAQVVESTHELYVKPDDRNEVNNVAGRAGEVIEPLLAASESTRIALSQGQPTTPLDDELVTCRFA